MVVPISRSALAVATGCLSDVDHDETNEHDGAATGLDLELQRQPLVRERDESSIQILSELQSLRTKVDTMEMEIKEITLTPPGTDQHQHQQESEYQHLFLKMEEMAESHEAYVRSLQEDHKSSMQAMKEKIDKLQKQQQQLEPLYDLSLPVSHSIEASEDNVEDEDAPTSARTFWTAASNLPRGSSETQENNSDGVPSSSSIQGDPPPGEGPGNNSNEPKRKRFPLSIIQALSNTSLRHRRRRSTVILGQADDSKVFYLADDIYSLLMTSEVHCSSKEWALGLFTIVFFQIGLGICLLYETVVTYDYQGSRWFILSGQCDCNYVPLQVPIRPEPLVTLAQFFALMFVFFTQQDLLSSSQTLLFLWYGNNYVAWENLFEGERGLKVWLSRILFPNLTKFLVSVFITLTASFVVVVRSGEVFELLKDMTALLVISHVGSVVFHIADMGCLGKHLAKQAQVVRNTQIEIVKEEEEPEEGKRFRNLLSPYTFQYVLFSIMCFGLIAGWSCIVYGQYSGNFAKLMYPNCDADVFSYAIPAGAINTAPFGDGKCDDSLNTEACGWDDGDCHTFDVFAGCSVPDPFRIGNGICDSRAPYFTAECKWDGGDCSPEGYPECIVPYPEGIGDGFCFDWPPYNTSICGFDGGDCNIPPCIDTLDLCTPNRCNVANPEMIGNEHCDIDAPYNTEECGWDGGDCPKREESANY